MKIAIFLSRIPWPLDKGDKLRAYYQIKELSTKHEITVFALTDSPISPLAYDELKKYCKNIYFFKLNKLGQAFNLLRSFFINKPFQIGYFYNKRIHKKINKLCKKINPDVCFFQLVRTAEYGLQLEKPKIIDYQDALSVGLERRILKAKGILRWLLKIEAKRLKKYESDIFQKFNDQLIITETDRELIPHKDRFNMKVIPNGVDIEYFSSKNAIKKYDIIFAGNLNYPPNIDAVNFLINEIMPIVWKSYPQANVLLAGANPNNAIKQKASPLVHVSGWIEDISVAYDESRIFVAPMRIGTGLQNKLLEAMSMGLPSITTSLANNALKATAESQILIGNSSVEIADQIIKLLNNNILYELISSEGYNFVKTHYSWKTVGNELEKILIDNFKQYRT
jgi:polysaccharide biosynthesis protein PslH